MPANIKNLARQVELLEDLEQVSQALMEIVQLAPATGSQLALNILRSTAGDVHLRAFSFSMLYRANLAIAYQYIKENSNKCETEVFLSMLIEVTEDAGLINESTDLQQVVAHLHSAILQRTDSNSEGLRYGIHEFLFAYGDRIFSI